MIFDRHPTCFIKVILISLLFFNCKLRKSDSELSSDTREHEVSILRAKLQGSLSETQLKQIKVIPTHLLADLPLSIQGFSPPFGKMPGFVIGVDPNGGESTYNKGAIDQFKVKMQKIFFQEERKGKKFFSAVAVRLGRFGFLTRRPATILLNRQAEQELADAYKSVEAAGLKSHFDKNQKQLEQQALIIKDDNDLYFSSFDLPIKEEDPTIKDPVPVTLVSSTGKVKIGPFFIPRDDEAIARTLSTLMN